MKLTDALSLQEGLDSSIVNDIVDIAMRPEFGSISGMDKVVQQEWEDISQLIRYIKEAIPTTTHYLFDTLVSKLEDRLPDTEFAQNLNERYGLPGNVGREFGEKFIRDLIGSGKFANLWTAFEATYPELQPLLQSTFEKSNDLLRYIKPEMGDETYKVSSMPEAAAQELDNLLEDILETLEFISSQNEQPGIEMVKSVIKDFDNTFSDMLSIFTSNTDSDKPLKPYKQTNIGFKEDALNKSKSNYNNWKKNNSNMKMKTLTEIYEEGIADATSDFKEFQLAWRNLDDSQREELLLAFIQPEEIKDIPTMEWEQLWHKQPMLSNNPDFQEALLAANFGGNGSVNEDGGHFIVVGSKGDGQVQYGPNYKTEEEAQKVADRRNNNSKYKKAGISFSVQEGPLSEGKEEYTAEEQWDDMNPKEKEIFLSSMNKQHLLHTHSFEDLKSEIPDFEDRLKADIDEGTCGYSVDGEGGDKPAGSHLLKKSDLQERFQKLANIIR